jgi:hypothetical protein
LTTYFALAGVLGSSIGSRLYTLDLFFLHSGPLTTSKTKNGHRATINDTKMTKVHPRPTALTKGLTIAVSIALKLQRKRFAYEESSVQYQQTPLGFEISIKRTYRSGRCPCVIWKHIHQHQLIDLDVELRSGTNEKTDRQWPCDMDPFLQHPPISNTCGHPHRQVVGYHGKPNTFDGKSL